MKIGIVSGFYNPISLHHLGYIKDAKSRCDILICIVNSDKQVKIKGSCPFQDEKTRLKIIKNLKSVDRAILAIDEDGGVSETIRKIYRDYYNGYRICDSLFGNPRKLEFFFGKGGSDRSGPGMLPSKEVETCKELGIEIVYGVGGTTKDGASSDLIKKAVEWYKEKEVERIIEDRKNKPITDFDRYCNRKDFS